MTGEDKRRKQFFKAYSTKGFECEEEECMKELFEEYVTDLKKCHFKLLAIYNEPGKYMGTDMIRIMERCGFSVNDGLVSLRTNELHRKGLLKGPFEEYTLGDIFTTRLGRDFIYYLETGKLPKKEEKKRMGE